jgi:hypothetical protein
VLTRKENRRDQLIMIPLLAQQLSDWMSYLEFLSSVVSLVLSIVAIWIALHFKRESDLLNKETTNLLIEIRSDAKTVAQVALPELRAYGESMRKLVIEKHYPGQPAPPAEENLVTALGNIESEIVSLRKATDISEIKRKLDDVSKDLDRSKKTAEKGGDVGRRDVNIQFPGGGGISFGSVDLPWGTILDLLAKEFTIPNFSVDAVGSRFVFINDRDKRVIDLPGHTLRTLTFRSTGVEPGDRLKLLEKEKVG